MPLMFQENRRIVSWFVSGSAGRDSNCGVGWWVEIDWASVFRRLEGGGLMSRLMFEGGLFLGMRLEECVVWLRFVDFVTSSRVFTLSNGLLTQCFTRHRVRHGRNLFQCSVYTMQ